MEDYKVKITVMESGCPRYQSGDSIYFNGAFIETEKSAALCMVALNAIYPFVYAARRGGRPVVALMIGGYFGISSSRTSHQRHSRRF